MTYERTVHGVLVVSKDGRDRFDDDDETTLNIFAGYAAHALLNATNMERLHRQQMELEHQLDGQRRLLEVNERLLSTLEPAGVLDLIADSLKAIVPYDSLTMYRIDRAAGVRRAVVARDRFADLILAYEGPLGSGISGWVIEHCEAVLANEAHLDPRSVQVPGTPFEPEAMIVVPLLVNGEAIGTLNIGRMGGPEASFSANEFELTQLFAGQASIALQNAEIHGAVRVRAEHDALTGLRNHGSFQRELGEAVASGGGGRPISILMLDLDSFKGYNDACGHPAGDALLASLAKVLAGATRDGDRLYRYGGDEFAAILPGADRQAAHEVAERIRHAVAELSDVDRRAARHDQRRGGLLPRRRTDQGRARRRGRPCALPGQAGRPVRGRSRAAGRSVPACARRDGAVPARPPRSDGPARDHHDPGHVAARDAALLHLPRRTGRRGARRAPRHRPVRRRTSAAACRSTTASPARSSERPRRWPSTTTTRWPAGRRPSRPARSARWSASRCCRPVAWSACSAWRPASSSGTGASARSTR